MSSQTVITVEWEVRGNRHLLWVCPCCESSQAGDKACECGRRLKRYRHFWTTTTEPKREASA